MKLFMETEYNNIKDIIMLRFKYILLITSSILIFSNCSKDELDTYKTEDSSIAFEHTLSDFSFMNSEDKESMVVSIPIRYIGTIEDYDRSFTAEVITDSLNNAPQGSYEILGGTIKAGEYKTTLQIKLLNDEVLLDSTYVLNLKVLPNEELGLINKQQTTTVVRWDNMFPRPAWIKSSSQIQYFTYYRTSTGSVVRGLYSRALGEAMLAAWGTMDINFWGWMGRTPEILAEYPIVQMGLPTFPPYLHQLEEYVYNYNKEHPDAPLRHSDDCVRFSGSNMIPVEGNPLIEINYYGL